MAQPRTKNSGAADNNNANNTYLKNPAKNNKDWQCSVLNV